MFHANTLHLKAGDQFLTVPDLGFLNSLVTLVEKTQALDNKAIFGHAGIILNSDGDTYEALWNVSKRNIADYNGKHVLIARYVAMDTDRFISGWDAVKQYAGQSYPISRLALHALGMSKIIHWHKLVCSEIVAKFNHHAMREDGYFDFEHYFGYTPDNLHDIYRNWKCFEIVYDGVL